MTRRFKPADLRDAFAALPAGASVRSRVRAVAVAAGCSAPTVIRAVKNADARRDGSHTTGGPSSATREPVALAHNHPAVLEGRTLFPSRVFDPIERVLKSGEHSAKIGARVVKGPWKGYPIFTLTLEERASCPPTCSLWAGCYGNNTPFARRFRHGADLEWRLEREVAALELEHQAGFVVRLHSLGDFYSREYVALWRRLIERHPALHIFGYTAHVDVDNDDVAFDLGMLVRELWPRFAVRFSGGWAKSCTTVVVEHERGAPADAIVCPAQTGKTQSCATCALCWGTRRRIAFLRH